MRKIIVLFFVIFNSILYAQNTVGTISITNEVMEGFTLFSANKKSFLINNCGQVINEWTSNFPPGNAVYLLPNGNLLRAGREDGKSDITFGGQGGIVELFDWDGNIIWSYSFNNNQERQHHDIYPMPNGNILVLLAESRTKEDAIANGRDPNKLSEERLYSEKIIEVKPIGNNNIEIVWEWNIFDHLIQDFDNTKSNFGDVSLNPNKLDINFLNGTSTNDNREANWLHINSIQYNETLDQIVISSRDLSEIWIIDHSTTTAQAATGTGGTYGKGGDLLYRWGNPQSYKQGSENDRKLYGQHFPYYIENGLPDAGKLILFNNGNGRTPSYSEVFIMKLPETNGVFSYTPNTAFEPVNPDFVYDEFNGIDNSEFFSNIVSGAQRLPNGNTLICEGSSGNFFEINANKDIVWNYINPVSNLDGTITNQGDAPSANLTFRATKYTTNYSAFTGRDVTPKNPIEGNFNQNPCNSLGNNGYNSNTISLYPNPSNGLFNLSRIVEKVDVFSLVGKKVFTLKNTSTINIKDMAKGVYFIKLYEGNNRKNIKVIKN